MVLKNEIENLKNEYHDLQVQNDDLKGQLEKTKITNSRLVVHIMQLQEEVNNQKTN
jgi:cell division septum initiation protein DivIVA